MTSIDRFAAATSGPDLLPAFQAALRRRWNPGIELASLEPAGVFPRADGGLAIHYAAQARDGDSRRWLSLRFGGHLVGPGQPLPATSVDDAFAVAELGLAVFVFPCDPGLPDLADLWSPATLPSILDSLDWIERPIGASPRILENAILGYRLEKRCVLRTVVSWRDRGDEPGRIRTLVIKTMSPRNIRRAQRGMEHLKRAGLAERWCARWPTVFAYDVGRGVQVMEFVAAPRLHDLFATGTLVEACESAAHAVADLHALDGDGLKPRGVDDELASLRATIECASWARPQWRTRLDGAYYTVAESLRAATCDRPCCIHGDYYDKQVLYHDEQTVVVDLDGLVAGDPAQDVGNFVAHLRLRALQHPECATIIHRARLGFTRAYDARNARVASRRAAWEAASLVRLAALYAVRPRWQGLTADLLDMAAGMAPARP